MAYSPGRQSAKCVPLILSDLLLLLVGLVYVSGWVIERMGVLYAFFKYTVI